MVRTLRAVVFDLDDTLYPEIKFVASGFEAVSSSIRQRGAEAPSVEQFLSLFREHRERVFNRAAEIYDFPGAWVQDLVTSFREHIPNIALDERSRTTLQQLRRRYNLACVTNGWARVQRKKLTALRLYELMDVIVVADELGRKFWKPAPQPLLYCCQKLRVSPSQTIVVGDNPDVDLRGAFAAGIRCIRMCLPGGYFSTDQAEYPHLADVRSLEELVESLESN